MATVEVAPGNQTLMATGCEEMDKQQQQRNEESENGEINEKMTEMEQ